MNILLIWLLLFGPFDPVVIPDYPAAVVPIMDLQPAAEKPGIARIQPDQGPGKQKIKGDQ